MKGEKAVSLLKDYWESKKGEEAFPPFENFDMEELNDIWDDCFTVEIRGNKFLYTHFGENVAEAYSFNHEGEEVAEDMLYPESPSFPHKLLETINVKEPVFYEGALINRENEDIKFHKIIVPLGDNGKITHIIGAVQWRLF